MTDTISSDLLYRAILHGASRTRDKKDDLNRINVFPVVDNDTGSNLAHTMHYILKNAKAQDNVRSTLKEIARSALIGARGNSGAIFSQYFNGLYLTSEAKQAVTLSELATCFHEAYVKAYKALETPVEGTVITLMRAWAVSFRESLEQRKTARELFESALVNVRHALEDTTSTLAALKSLGIVDAGALGYYTFMDGFVQVILGQSIYVHQEAELQITPTVEADIHAYGEHAEFPYRYCTEVLIESDTLDQGSLRESLKPLGDCLLLSAGDNLARVHLHTNEPWTVIKRTAALGKVLEHKAEDMVWQNVLAGPPVDGIACVTDSVADLPPSYVHEHQIYQIPINIMVDGVSFEDKITVDSDFLNAHLDTASSAQLNTEQAKRFLEPIFAHYRQVLVLTVSSHMSGTYSRFKEALAELDPDGKRSALVDTRVNSGAQGLLVRAAVGQIEAGRPFDEIVRTIEAMRGRAGILVSVPDLGPMVRSGRISEKVGDFLIRLGFRPLVSITKEGKGTIKGVAFSVEKNRRLLMKSLRGKQIEDYVIVHADAADRAESCRRELVRMTGKEPLYITQISSVVTLFAGKGSLAVAYLEKEAVTA